MSILRWVFQSICETIKSEQMSPSPIRTDQIGLYGPFGEVANLARLLSVEDKGSARFLSIVENKKSPKLKLLTF